jgi:hypothetical protein
MMLQQRLGICLLGEQQIMCYVIVVVMVCWLTYLKAAAALLLFVGSAWHVLAGLGN